jgi:hypothetical protein
VKFYYLVEKDPVRSSWAIHDVFKALPKRPPQPGLPPALHRFFGPDPDGEMVLKPQYTSIVCKSCGQYDDDAAFDIGFSDPVKIHVKGDFGHTEDRVFAISARFLNVLKGEKVRGFETKPLGSSRWYALRVTERVDCDESVMQEIGPFCKKCGRPDTVPGEFLSIEQLSLPSQSNTLFTTKRGWAKPFRDRDTFLTEDVVETLKNAGIKGGWCNRLWTSEETKKIEDQAKRGKKWKPPKSIVTL